MNNKIKLIAIVGTFLLLSGVADAKMLSVGSRGTEVASLQTFLIDNGFPIPLIESGKASKGYFGEQTRNAVQMYQEGNEMNPTGSIDSNGYKTVKLGSVASPDIMSPYFSFGGVRQWAGRMETLTTSTTTVCAIQAPAATSTLVAGSIRFSVGSTTATTITMAKATTAYATTTSLGTSYLSANAQGTFIASTSPMLSSPIDPSQVFGPSTWFVVGMAGNIGTFSPTGVCQAIWREI